MRKKLFLMWLIGVTLLVGCQSANHNNIKEDEVFSTEFFAMDTIMTITAYGPKGEEAVTIAQAEVTRLEQLLSTNIDSSEIAKLNLSKHEIVSKETIKLIQTSIEMYNQMNGTFDIAIFPIVKAWGFTTDTYQVPSEGTIVDLLQYTDANDIIINEETCEVTLGEHMEIGLGGIVKGYTSQRIMEIFEEEGIASGIVNLGGNVQTLGVKPDGSSWNVAIKDPINNSAYAGVVSVENKAVITSGPYERFFEADGKIYHHLMDPKTGMPADNELISVTIISENGTNADALTKIFVMGLSEAVDYWRSHRDEFDVILITNDKRIYITENLKNCFTVQSQEWEATIIE